MVSEVIIPHPAYFYIPVSANHALRSAMLFGNICATWRPDGRDYRENTMVSIGCAKVLFGFEARIRNVRTCIISALSPKDELPKIGFPTGDALVEYLERYYGKRVQIYTPHGQYVEWENPRGFLVDHKEEYRDNPVKLYRSITPFGEEELKMRQFGANSG